MNKKDILELKRRYTRKSCTFTRICGRYVDSDKKKIVDINETFLNLDDEEFFKYLDIAKKVLSGTPGNNILNPAFPNAEEEPGGRQKFLLGLRDSRLKNDELLERFFEQIIENYDYSGHYLILLMHDAYDVITKASDNSKLDESEEVFEYVLCAICPVTLSKAALGYRPDENRIGPRIRDWIVDVPANGFIFPAFSDRSGDIHSIMYYSKDPKDTHPELMQNILGCKLIHTGEEQKRAFSTIINDTLGDDSTHSNHLIMKINSNIHELVEDETDPEDDDAPPILLTSDKVQGILKKSGITEELSRKIEADYSETFDEEPPAAEFLIDKKAVETYSQIQKEQELLQEVQALKRQLIEKSDSDNSTAASDTNLDEILSEDSFDVIVHVKPELAPLIKSQILDGQKCIVIPVEEDRVNVISASYT